MIGQHKAEGQPHRGRLFHYLDLLMDGRSTEAQRRRVEHVNALLQLRPGETMNMIVAVYEFYLAALESELADVSRQVRRGMGLACAASLITCFLVVLPCIIYFGSRIDSVSPAAAPRPESCAKAGPAFCNSVAAITADSAKSFLTTVIAQMPAEDADVLAHSQAGITVWVRLGRLTEPDRQAVADWIGKRTVTSP